MENNYIPVKALTDDASHWYLVPDEFVKEFLNLMEKIEEGLSSYEKDFEQKFSKQRIGGGPNESQLYIKK